MYFIQASHMCTYHTISYCICISCNITFSNYVYAHAIYTHHSISTPVSHWRPTTQESEQEPALIFDGETYRIDYFKHNSIYFWLCRVLDCCAGFSSSCVPRRVKPRLLMQVAPLLGTTASQGVGLLQLQFPGQNVGSVAVVQGGAAALRQVGSPQTRD